MVSGRLSVAIGKSEEAIRGKGQRARKYGFVECQSLALQAANEVIEDGLNARPLTRWTIEDA